MPTSTVALDTSQYVRVNVGLNPLILQAHRDSVRVVVSSQKPAAGNTAFHLLNGGDPPLHFDSLDTNVWVRGVSDRSSLIVTETKKPVAAQLSDAVGNHPIIAGFGELLVGMKNTDIQVQFVYNLADAMVIDGSTGTGSATHSEARAVVSSGAGVGLGRLTSVDSVIYRAGHDVLSFFTAAFSPGEADTSQHVGPHDDENGYNVGFTGTLFGINRIRASVSNFTAQADFSEDPLDGTGESGRTIVPGDMNIFSISYGHLGKLPAKYWWWAGYRYGWILFHVEEPAIGKDVNIINPNLPIRADAQRTAGTGAVTVHTASWHACTVGEPAGRAGNRHDTAEASASINTETYVPLVSVYNKTTYPTAAPLTNHIPGIVEFLSMTADGTKAVTFALIEDGVLTGASFTDIDAVNSVMQADTSATAVSGGRRTIPIGLAPVDSKFIRLDKDDVIIRPGRLVTLAAKMSKAASTSDVTGAIHWNEAF